MTRVSERPKQIPYQTLIVNHVCESIHVLSLVRAFNGAGKRNALDELAIPGFVGHAVNHENSVRRNEHRDSLSISSLFTAFVSPDDLRGVEKNDHVDKAVVNVEGCQSQPTVSRLRISMLAAAASVTA